MNVTCPSCGAENTVDKAGQEAVCVQCFNVWTVTEGATGEVEADQDVTQATMLDSQALQAIPLEPVTGAFETPTDSDTDTATVVAGAAFAPPAPPAPPAEETSAFAPPAPSEGEPAAFAPPAPPEGEPAAFAPPAPPEAAPADGGGDSAAEFSMAAAFGRPKRSALSSDDMASLGRRSSTPVQEESIYGSGGPPAAKKASDALWEAEKKAASQTSGGGLGDPFGGGGGGATNAFGGNAGAATEGFGGGSIPEADPFADVSSSPSPGVSFDDDPFADVAPSPPAAGDDPFASPDFGGGASGGSSSSPEPDPVGPGSLEEIGFDSLAVDDLPESEFDGAPMTDSSGPSGDEVLSVDELDDSMFDVEDDGADESAAVELDEQPKKRGKRGKRRRGKRGRGDGNSKGKVIAVLIVVLVLGGAYAAMELGIPIPGLEGLMGNTTQNMRPQRPRRPKKPAGKQQQAAAEAPSVNLNTPGAFVSRIQDLQTQFEKAPEDSDIGNQLADALLNLRERYPEIYGKNPSHAESMEQLVTNGAIQLGAHLKIRHWLLDGKVEDAAAAAKLFETSTKPADLVILGRLAEAQGNQDLALERYGKAVESGAAGVEATEALARLQVATGALQAARISYEKLLEGNPQHGGAKVALARITIFEKRFPEAGKLIDDLLTQAKASDSVHGQFEAFMLKADLAEAMEKLDEYGYALERAFELKPGDVTTAVALSRFLRDQEKVADALERLVVCEKEGGASAEFTVALVETLSASGDDERAAEKLTAGLEANPNNSALLMLQASRKEKEGHLKTAKALYARIIETNPRLVEAYLALCKILVAENKPDEAVKVLDDGSKEAHDKLALLAEMAEIQMKSGSILKAKETMARILAIDPSNLSIKRRFARILKDLKHWDESAKYYKDLQEAGALKGSELLDYAVVLEILGRTEESEIFADKVLSKDPMNVRANILLGSIHRGKEEYERSKSFLERALKVDSNSSQAHFELGLTELAQNRMESAIKLLTQAKALNGDDLDIRFALGKALMSSSSSDDNRNAMAEFTFVTDQYDKYSEGVDKIRPDPDVYLSRGRLHFRNSDLKSALSDFKAAMLIDPSRQDVIIDFAATLRTHGKPQEAKAYLKEVLSRDPKNAKSHYNLAMISLKGGDRNTAEDHFKKTIAYGEKEFPTAHRYLAYIYKDKGLKILMCNGFKAYLRHAPKDAPDREEIARQVATACK